MKKILQKCKSSRQNDCSPNITTTLSAVDYLRQQQEIVYNECTKKHQRDYPHINNMRPIVMFENAICTKTHRCYGDSKDKQP
ncbi:hypothetical protein [Prevotella intermedia]|uniref:hypothetical protein n=1 Tax=Prevotella intermedia TaxID=28131 RepID=UPI00211B31D4|nr:hypothetical protein [Prevotella intermedia]